MESGNSDFILKSENYKMDVVVSVLPASEDSKNLPEINQKIEIEIFADPSNLL